MAKKLSAFDKFITEGINYHPQSITPVAPQKSDFAQYLISHSYGGPLKKDIASSLAKRDGAETEGPSLLSSIFDTLSIPLYAVTGAIDAAGEADSVGDFFKEEGENLLATGARLTNVPLKIIDSLTPDSGLPGLEKLNDLETGLTQTIDKSANKLQPKKFTSDLLDEAGIENPFLKYGLGFVGDVLLDPITYVPGLNLTKLREGKRLEDLVSKGFRETIEDTGPREVPQVESLFGLRRGAEAEAAAQKTNEVREALSPILSRPVAEEAVARSMIPTIETSGKLLPDFNPVRNPESIAQRILDSPEDLAAMKAAKRSDDARRAANVRHGRPIDFHETNPIDKAALSDWGRQMSMASRKVISDGKGNVSQVAVARVVNDMMNGAIPRFGPEIERAEGKFGDNAIKHADTAINRARKKAPQTKQLKPDRQASLYQSIVKSAENFTAQKLERGTPEFEQAVRTLSLSMLKTAEDHLISKGVQPTYWNGMRVRLSDIIAETGMHPQGNTNEFFEAFLSKNPKAESISPEVQSAVTKALARRSLANADMLENLSKRIVEGKKQLLEDYNYPVAKAGMEQMEKEAVQVLRASGHTEEELKAAVDLIRNYVKVEDDMPIQEVLDRAGPELIDAVIRGQLDSKVLEKINKAMVRTLGSTPEKLSKDVTGNGVVDGFMTRVSTAFGRQREMKRYSEDVFKAAEEYATLRARWLKNILRDYKKDEIAVAFRIAQRKYAKDLEVDPRIMELANKLSNYVENLVGSSGFKNITDYAGVAAVKSQVAMDDLNKQLKAVGSNFQFVNTSKGKDVFTGMERDYSEKGLGWLSSWENVDPLKYGQDPVSFLYDLDRAMQRTVAENSLFDEFAMRFGAKKTDGHFDHLVHKDIIPHPRLQGYYFHPEIKKEFQRLIEDLETGIYRPNSPIMRFYANGLKIWKTLVTIYSPSHHVRNLIGDNWNTWAAGHNNPAMFEHAAKVIYAYRKRYGEALKSPEMDVLNRLVSKDAMDWANSNPTSHIFTNKKTGVKLSAEQLYTSAFQHGLLLDVNKIEDIFGETPFGKIIGTSPRNKVMQRLSAPFGGRVHNVAQNIAEMREHYARMSHYISAVDKNLTKYGSKDMERVYREAAHEVRKWHPDGSDLTQFEQKARYAIPFYSWTRKEIPLLVQTAALRPSKIMFYPRAQRALAGMAGIESDPGEGLLDPYPDNEVFPYWLRASGIGPVGDSESDNPIAQWFGKLGAKSLGLNGAPQGYTIINPSYPFSDVITSFTGFGRPEDIFKNSSNMLTPLLKIPADLASNESFTGAPISKSEGGDGFLPYFLDQIPQASTAQRLLVPGGNENVVGTSRQNLLNFLTALGVRGASPYSNSAEFEARDRARNGN